MKIAILGNEFQNKDQIEKIFEALAFHRVEVWMQKEFANYLTQTFGFENGYLKVFEGTDFCVDFAFSIGGDGTFLRTVAAIGEKNIPILGINTGHLGFLADINENTLDETLQEIFAGKYRVEERSQLELVLEDSDNLFNGQKKALNEIAILKQDTASMITVHTYIDGGYLTSYQSDGLLVVTPTGSTAYSLSIGGPILTPDVSNFILAGIAPHSLNMRPLVIEDSSIITLEVESRNRNFLISLDGRSEVLPSSTCLTIRKSDSTVKLVKRIGHTFYETLKDKLMWGIDPRNK